MNDVLRSLLRRAGRYGGHGINHEDEPFYGELELTDLLGGHGVSIRYRATGIDGTALHDERTWIAASDAGALALWTISSNASQVMRHELAADHETDDCERVLKFRLGDPADRGIYRNQVTLELFKDGRLGYRYAWGLPGQPFEDRSSVALSLASLVPKSPTEP